MNSLFITGASGLIGRYLIRRIVPEKYEKIYCLRRSQQQYDLPGSFEFINGNLCDPGSYGPVLSHCDTVIHLAGVTGKAPRNQYFLVNSDGTRLLLEECKKRNVRSFLYVSTIAVKYTDKNLYYYAQSKELAEEAVRASGLNFAILRPTIVLAEDAPLWKKLSGLVHKRVVIVPGNGKTKIQPIHIEDLVECIQTILEENLFSGEVFEAGGPDAIELDRFLLAVHRHMYRMPASRRLYRDKHPLLLRIPLKPFLAVLGFLEKKMDSALPVSVGQFSAFYNDGAIAPNRLMDRCGSTMKSLNRMLEELTSHA